MRSGRNLVLSITTSEESLVDWEMRSGRNLVLSITTSEASLVDWEMRSGRNQREIDAAPLYSLVDWEMRSGRPEEKPVGFHWNESSFDYPSLVSPRTRGTLPVLPLFLS